MKRVNGEGKAAESEFNGTSIPRRQPYETVRSAVTFVDALARLTPVDHVPAAVRPHHLWLDDVCLLPLALL